MTNKEIVDTYFVAHGFRQTKGGAQDFSPILPFLMLDEVYTMYRRTILPIKCAHQMKQSKMLWAESYNAFNKDFFACYTKEQTEAIIERMDDFEQFIAKDEMIVKVQIMNEVNFEPLERQDVIATCLLCSILVQSAQVVWRRIYKNSLQQDTENIALRNIRRGIVGFMNEYYGKNKPDIKVDDNPQVAGAVGVLCRNMIKWLKQ